MSTFRRFIAYALGQSDIQASAEELRNASVPVSEAGCRNCADPCDQGGCSPSVSRGILELVTEVCVFRT